LKYFNEDEFKCKCGCGKDVTTEVKQLADKARGISGVPWMITSGARCDAHNKKIGASSTSSHTVGYAIDVRATTSREKYLILKSMIEVGFNRIGVADTFIHGDIDPNKSPSVLWTY
jgi:zinc D-Ala-D-Ala carboxypeptidase